MKKYKQTPSQTIGPFFAQALTPDQYGYNFSGVAQPTITDESADGEQITIKGQIYDGEGNTVVDAMLEFWQCDSKGKYISNEQDPGAKGFKGFGRVGTGTDKEQYYEVKTIKPCGIGNEAPYINVVIFMRGMLNHQYTRIYFSDENEKNEQDSILKLVPINRRKTLIAERKDENEIITYWFDIHIQGAEETVFFDV